MFKGRKKTKHIKGLTCFFPVSAALGEEPEAEPEPEDTRRCLFCSRLGDDVVEVCKCHIGPLKVPY